LACVGGSPEDTGRDSAPTPTTATDPCEGVPALSWESFGHGFLLSHCDGCHAAEAPNRYDAPEDVVFDTPEQAWAWAERILARAAADPPSMPPNGGVSEDDRTRLSWWLTCGVPGT